MSQGRDSSAENHSPRASARESPRRDEMLIEIAVVQRRVRHGSAALRCVDETAGSDVDPYVIHVSGVKAEKHEVAGRQLRKRYGLRGSALFAGGTRNVYACAFVGVDGKAAAIETESVGAAEVIGSSDEAGRDLRDLRPLPAARPLQGARPLQAAKPAQVPNGRGARRVSRTRRKQ